MELNELFSKYIMNQELKDATGKPLPQSTFAKGEFKGKLTQLYFIEYDTTVHQCLAKLIKTHEEVDSFKHQLKNSYEIDK